MIDNNKQHFITIIFIDNQKLIYMKRIFGIIVVTAILFFAYSCNSADKAAKAEAEKLKKEILVNDSISLRMENITSEIDSSAKEVNKLLNEL
jgi:hypothetical protein